MYVFDIHVPNIMVPVPVLYIWLVSGCNVVLITVQEQQQRLAKIYLKLPTLAHRTVDTLGLSSVVLVHCTESWNHSFVKTRTETKLSQPQELSPDHAFGLPQNVSFC